jgi:hypothetical protein
MSSPRASVCICTHHGAGRIGPLLDALTRQSAPRAAVEARAAVLGGEIAADRGGAS